MRAIATWLANPNRQPFLRFFRVSALLVLVMVVLWQMECREKEQRALWSRSPSGSRTAILSQTSGWGATVGTTSIVRVQSGLHGPVREVWRAYSVPPFHLVWHGDDSLVVVVPEQERAREHDIRVRKQGLKSVTTEFRAFSDSALSSSPVGNPRTDRPAEGFEDRQP